MGAIVQERFEREECEHEWDGIPQPMGHTWETCPNCGADDGENCWDCGENVVEDDDGGRRCTSCQRTLCWDCTGGMRASFYSPHRSGRAFDSGLCGTSPRAL